MNPARGGLGYLVYSTGATVVPVTIDTFFNISLIDFLLRRKKVTITVGKPIMPDEIISPVIKNPSVLDFQSGAQKVLNNIAEAIE
jgi:1-acyl-sn-glycerol-3-phosphate acyltransferase